MQSASSSDAWTTLTQELLQFDANSREFRAKLEELQTNLNQARDAGLPPYDLRKRQEALSGYRKQCAAAAPKKPAFSFGSRRVTPAPPTSVESSPPTKTTDTPGHAGPVTTGAYMTPSQGQGDTASLNNLDQCVVDLRLSATLASAHLQHLYRCLVLLPSVSGSLLLDHLADCSIYAESIHQLRIHSSTSTSIYANVQTSPILEDCTQISIGSGQRMQDFADPSGRATDKSWIVVDPPNERPVLQRQADGSVDVQATLQATLAKR